MNILFKSWQANYTSLKMKIQKINVTVAVHELKEKKKRYDEYRNFHISNKQTTFSQWESWFFNFRFTTLSTTFFPFY